jgi:hypothetical protein
MRFVKRYQTGNERLVRGEYGRIDEKIIIVEMNEMCRLYPKFSRYDTGAGIFGDKILNRTRPWI